MNMICEGGYSRITKAEARKRYSSGASTYVLPCKMSPENHWSEPLLMVNDSMGTTFECWLNGFCYYNCDRVRGTYPSFYIRDLV